MKSVFRLPRRVLPSIAMLCVTPCALAQNWKTEADITVEEAFTDNVRLVETGAESDWVTTVSPGLRIDGRGGRSELKLDARALGYLHTNESDANRVALNLGARGSVEAVENFIFIDADAYASEQDIGLFGPSGTGINADDNRAQFGSASIQPRAVWRLGQNGSGSARYRVSYSDSDTAVYRTQIVRDWDVFVGFRPPRAGLGWNVRVDGRDHDYKTLTDTSSKGVRLSALYVVSSEFEVYVNGGYERNNYRTAEEKGYTNWGGGLVWRPTPRTVFSLDGSHRYFGTGYQVSLSHTRGRSRLRVELLRDVSASWDAFGFGFDDGAGTPVGSLDTLQQTRTLDTTGRVTLVLTGVRNTITLMLSQAQRQKLLDTTQTLSLGGSSFSGTLSSFDRVTERNARVDWSSKISALTTLTAGIGYTQARGEGTSAEQHRRQLTVSTGLARRVGAQSVVGLQYRFTNAHGTATYRENSVAARLSHRF